MKISFSLPKSQFVTESPEEVKRKIRMFAALGLYQAGELSAGAASELAGLDRYEFLEFCKRA
jgi:predicted HTH domain antitoxin